MAPPSGHHTERNPMTETYAKALLAAALGALLLYGLLLMT